MSGGGLGVVTRDNWIADLPVAVRDAVLARMHEFDVPAGETVARAGAPAKHIFQVVDGYVRLDGLHADGRQALITIYLPGNCYAETAMVARRSYHHTSTAMVASRVRLLGEAAFWELYERFPEIADALCRKFAGAITRQIASREWRATQRLNQRVALMFDNLSNECGFSLPNGEILIAVPLRQSDIADLFDVTRQSVQREVSALKARDIIAKRGGAWLVKSPERLRRLVGASPGAQ